MGMAQQITGTILGTVKDVSGGVISSAAVTVTNEDTNIEFKATTGAAGDYLASNLQPGIYTITTEFAGFKLNAVKRVRLLANRSVRVDVVLEPGAVTQAVEVRASAPVVNSESATVGSIMEGNLITALPLNGRNIDQLVLLAAGMTTDSARNPRLAGSAYWGGTQFNVNGANFNDSGNGGASYGYATGLSTFPSIDSISEFKVDSNNQKAEYEAAATVTIVTKSGSNELHGSVFEFNRNKAFAAQRAMLSSTAPKSPFNRNEFGFTLGGPVLKNKTFFFGNYEATRLRYPGTSNVSVATAAMRSGDFSGLPTIVDPLAGAPFANNRVPDTRIDSRSKTLIGYLPLPNKPGSGPAGTLNNWTGDMANRINVNRFGPRIDHRFSEKDSVWGSFNYSKGDPYFVARGYVPTYGHFNNAGYRTMDVNAAHVHTFSSRAVNEFRFVWLNHAGIRIGMNTDFDARKLFPDIYGPLPLGGLPNMQISGHTPIGDYGGSARAPQITKQYVENFTIVLGHHTLKTGLDFDIFSAATPPSVYGMGMGEAQDAGFGRFDFNGRFTNDSTSAAQPAHAFADFLLGFPNTTYRASFSRGVEMYTSRYSAYVQDDWQVSPRLTLNLGLRYMVQKAWKEQNGNQANFDFSTGKLVVPGDKMPPLALQRIVDALPVVTSTQAGLPGEVLETDKNNFGPRFGFAYRPFGGSKTVIRGGAGMFFNFLPVFIGFNQLGTSNAPFVLSETFESDPGRLPSLTLAKPYPGLGSIPKDPAATAVERKIKNSVAQQWNLTVERELVANLGLRVSYVGNKSTNLPYYNYERNVSEKQIPGALQPNRPYKSWSSVAALEGGGDSTIHQLQIGASQRYAHGITAQVEYSWNRSLDNVPIVGGPQNPYNAAVERGNSEGIRRHIITMAGNYDLPFGPGKRFVSVSGPVGIIVGGWQLGTVALLRTGTPFSVSFNATQPGWRGGRADLIADPRLSDSARSTTQYFNTAAFAVPTPFTYGNSARNLLFRPGAIDMNLSLMKNTKVAEKYTVQLRGEFFNVANHPNLGGPSTNVSVPATFGKILSWSGSREIQFAVKLLF
jgi:hypothetical protein